MWGLSDADGDEIGLVGNSLGISVTGLETAQRTNRPSRIAFLSPSNILSWVVIPDAPLPVSNMRRWHGRWE